MAAGPADRRGARGGGRVSGPAPGRGDRRHRGAGRAGLAWVLAAGVGCATVETRTTVRVVGPAPGGRVPRAPAGTLVVGLGAVFEATQVLDEVSIVVRPSPRCARVAFDPVVVEGRVARRAGATLGWELGLGAALAGFGAFGLARPETISTARVGPTGEVYRDRSTGLRLAGTLGAVGALLLVAGVADAVRARDTVRHVEGVRPRLGDPAGPCAVAEVPLAGRRLAVRVAGRTRWVVLDGAGRVRVRLPPERVLAEAGREPALFVGFDRGRAVRLPLALPYGATHARPHRTTAVLDAEAGPPPWGDEAGGHAPTRAVRPR